MSRKTFLRVGLLDHRFFHTLLRNSTAVAKNRHRGIDTSVGGLGRWDVARQLPFYLISAPVRRAELRLLTFRAARFMAMENQSVGKHTSFLEVNILSFVLGRHVAHLVG
jgi:hypothetical protein